MEVEREIIIKFDFKDKKDYEAMVARLLEPKRVGFKQYIELTEKDKELLMRLKKALTVYDKPQKKDANE